MQVSVSIVHYQVPELLEKCLKSLTKALEGIESEIIIVNNDDDLEIEKKIKTLFPGIRWIQNQENVGFGRAHNQALKQASGEYVLILNPDTDLGKSKIQELIQFSEDHPKAGVTGVQMRDENGNYLPESKRNIPTLSNAFEKELNLKFLAPHQKYYAEQVGENDIAKVPIISGAFMWMSIKVFNEVKGFDERYFMYAEDIDISIEVMNKGYTNYYKGDFVITHLKGKSAAKNAKSKQHFYGTMQQFIDKRYSNFFQKKLYQFFIQLAAFKNRWIGP